MDIGVLGHAVAAIAMDVDDAAVVHEAVRILTQALAVGRESQTVSTREPSATFPIFDA